VALQHNMRAGAARNFGVQASTGDVLFFCDSDDLYLEVRQTPPQCLRDKLSLGCIVTDLAH
jgi:hypothetical protein